MAVCSVRSNCVLYLVVVGIVVCPKLSCVQWSVNGGQEKSSRLCKLSPEWDSCSLILLIRDRFVCPLKVAVQSLQAIS